LPCINTNKHEFLGGFSHHPNGREDKHQEWKNKNACQVVTSNGSTTKQAKKDAQRMLNFDTKKYGI
jgi:hypothetical protein